MRLARASQEVAPFSIAASRGGGAQQGHAQTTYGANYCDRRRGRRVGRVCRRLLGLATGSGVPVCHILFDVKNDLQYIFPLVLQRSWLQSLEKLRGAHSAWVTGGCVSHLA